MKKLWDWVKDKLLGPIIVAIIIAVIAFVVGLVSLPVKMSLLEEQTKKIPDILTTVAELKANQDNFKRTTEEAGKNVREFNDELRKLAQTNGELKANVENLKGLSTDIRDLRKAIDELRLTAAQLSENVKNSTERLKQDRTIEVSAVVFLSEQNLKREGNLFMAQFQYPERLGGRPVREVRTRLGSIIPIPGVSTLSAFTELQPTGYSLQISVPDKEADAVAQFLKKQPIRVEIIYMIDW